jgi:thiosulfate/3-mercaptopyruvate sulfurtransferase
MMAAARIIWALLYAGVGRVWLLDGGLDAWLASGRETSFHIESAAEIADTDGHAPLECSPWPVRRDLLATTAEVYEVSKSGRAGSKLVDVRGRGEWDGTQEHHYTFFSKAGHIPTAEYQGDWDNLVDTGTQRLAPMLNAVAQRWRELGILDSQVEAGSTALIFYCGTGWRSSIALLVALLLGLRAKNYDDGFYGWSWSGENEIAVDPLNTKACGVSQHPARLTRC